MTTTTTTTERRVRQLSPSELDARYPIDCTIDPRTGVVRVTKLWEQVNLVRVQLPDGFGIEGKFWLHKDAAPVFQEWFRAIGKADLRRDIMTFNGGYNPRLKRGEGVPKTKAGLSRHARGLASDFNAMWNPMGKPPAAIGSTGTMMRIAPLAKELGLVWGGDWHGSSCDPMHVELGIRD